jgi:UDP-2,4-diacetamido-2,4,6-trideoxy-beta-L-altropyranose hydrolase
MKIAFRTDASFQIGTGHVIRCLTLAEALRKKGATCSFICRKHEGNLIERVRQSGFETIEIPMSDNVTRENERGNARISHAHWLGADWQSDAAQTTAALSGELLDWLIVDHYAIDQCWESAMRSQCKRILVIDDLADRHHDCDLLLDQNLVEGFESRYRHLLPANTACLLGPEYSLLQPHYADLHPCAPPRLGPIQRILVYFGGADLNNLTGLAISAFLELNLSEITLDVIINPNGPHTESVRRQVHGIENITLHEQLPSLANLMLKADLAIGACGTTTWERCCLGLPTLAVTVAENQKAIANKMADLGIIRLLGDQDSVDCSGIKKAIKAIIETPNELRDWSLRCRSVLDGRGTNRVADILLLNDSTPLTARKAAVADEDLLLGLANDPLVRKNGLHPKSIDPITHRDWFHKRLRSPEACHIFIVETEQHLPIGMVRFENCGNEWEIHYSLTAYALGRNLGTTLLKTAMTGFRKLSENTQLFGRVKAENTTSHKSYQDTEFLHQTRTRERLTLAVCSDANSWINHSIPDLILKWLAAGHKCAWTNKADMLPGGDICFFLSYSRIADEKTRSRYHHNLVVHASDLPKGRGWSPASWMILEGQRQIPVTLLEAEDSVDSGAIYAQEWFDVEPTDLVEQWRKKLSDSTINLVSYFVNMFPESAANKRYQIGEATYYARRRVKDSELDPNLSLNQQFRLLQIVDNDSYPAWFTYNGKQFTLKIIARDPI